MISSFLPSTFAGQAITNLPAHKAAAAAKAVDADAFSFGSSSSGEKGADAAARKGAEIPPSRDSNAHAMPCKTDQCVSQI